MSVVMSSAAPVERLTAHGVSVATSSGVADAGGPVAGQVLPTRTELAAVLPWPGLRRGSTVAVHGSVFLLCALLAEATARGSWAAVLELPGLGLAAAAEVGVEVSRLGLVPDAGADPAGVVAALLDGVDLVVVGNPRRLSSSVAQRLSARARHRGAVLLPFGEWPGADVQLHCGQSRWRGPEAGAGHLRAREATLRATGRGAASRPRSTSLLLPDPHGTVSAPAEPRPTLRSVGA